MTIRMTDQQQRTRWALDLFQGFISEWVAPKMQAHLVDDDHNDGERVRRAIRDIAPKDDTKAHVGWAVFKRELDHEYDRERPSGFIHTMVSAVFETTVQVDNAYRGACKRHPANFYVVCEVREIP